MKTILIVSKVICTDFVCKGLREKASLISTLPLFSLVSNARFINKIKFVLKGIIGKTSLVGKLATIIEVKAPAAKIHEVLSCRPHIVTITSPENVQSCELLEGEWGKPGCVICWRFCRDTDESPQIAKEQVEIIDNENFVTSFKLIEGRVLEKYTSFYSIAKVNPKDEGSLVRWSYNYEKQNEDVTDLESKLLQLVINNIKDIDAYLLNQQQLQLQA